LLSTYKKKKKKGNCINCSEEKTLAGREKKNFKEVSQQQSVDVTARL
jgi:hypothetical protein